MSDHDIREAEPAALDAAGSEALHDALERALLQALVPTGSDPARLAAVARAEAVVVSLMTSLDARAGGELARRLGALYRYMDGELRAQRRTPDDDRLDELLELAVGLRSVTAPAGDRRSAGFAG